MAVVVVVCKCTASSMPLLEAVGADWKLRANFSKAKSLFGLSAVQRSLLLDLSVERERSTHNERAVLLISLRKEKRKRCCSGGYLSTARFEQL